MSDFDSLFKTASIGAKEIFERNFKSRKGFETSLTHGGHTALELPDMGHPAIPPITLSTTFQQIEPATGKYDYSRSGNYSRDILEKCLAEIENGEYAMTFASGLAALGAVLQVLSTGDHVVAFNDLYGGTGRYFRNIASKSGLKFDFVDMRDESLFKSSLRNSTKMVFLETPSNPLMQLVDISAISRISHEFNKDIIVVVDNTFMTPYYQRPLDLGADVSLSSLTKYINGHGDVVMGCLVVRHGHAELSKQIRFIQFAAGAVPSAFDCYLCLRGLRTLALRMRAHMLSGLVIAKLLEGHPKVENVLHPGLKSHEQHELAVQQMTGFSGMVCVYLKCSAEETSTFVKNLKFFCLAESLGGYESLIEIPSLMTHASVPVDVRQKLHITDNMLRISVGLEDCYDLARDLYNALEKI